MRNATPLYNLDSERFILIKTRDFNARSNQNKTCCVTIGSEGVSRRTFSPSAFYKLSKPLYYAHLLCSCRDYAHLILYFALWVFRRNVAFIVPCVK